MSYLSKIYLFSEVGDMNTTAWHHTELFCYKMVLLARTSFLIILISENIQIVHNRDILVSFTVVVIRLLFAVGN